MDADPRLYGRSFADVYDEWYTDVSDVSGTVGHIVQLAGDGLVLELGSGTGRLAAPMAAAGLDVVGLDASAEMNRRFAAKRVPVPILEADMAALPVAGATVRVVLIAFNTICNLAAVGAQQRCLLEANRVLEPGGRLVIEVLVPPDPDLMPRGATSVRSDDGDVVVLTSTAAGDDPDHVVGRHIEIHGDGTRRVRPWELRWVGPTRLDTLARQAGLDLVERHADWHGTRFGPAAEGHVSVYGTDSG